MPIKISCWVLLWKKTVNTLNTVNKTMINKYWEHMFIAAFLSIWPLNALFLHDQVSSFPPEEITFKTTGTRDQTGNRSCPGLQTQPPPPATSPVTWHDVCITSRPVLRYLVQFNLALLSAVEVTRDVVEHRAASQTSWADRRTCPHPAASSLWKRT